MNENSLKIAIIGMAGRFPGAENLDAFWHNLRSGVSGGKMLAPAENGRVSYGFSLDNADHFDANFFAISAREAKLLDPQQRLFLECAYLAMEHAGVPPCASRDLVGVFGSCNFNGYALRFADSLLHGTPLDLVDLLAASDKDYLAARVAYKLNLKGPALTVQCACSSSLAAVAMACQAILSGQCDMALAGGAGLKTSENVSYRYEPEGALSMDGHVRAYSDDASGVNEGEGAAVVVLKRFEDALRDNNVVYAVISGFAVGNDGADKTGFYAPSVSGQAAVMADALAMSGVDPLEIGYVEGHGTGTPIGDPMEVAALTQAWALPDGAPKQYCLLGSVKTGIGHLNAAAGVASLIKTVLALHHKIIPASLDFRAPNPRLNLEKSPFRIADSTVDWVVAEGKTRKAAVNSLGIGGNNVHLILEEGVVPAASPHAGAALVVLSAKTERALAKRVEELNDWLRERPEPLADVAHTLLLGRDMHAFRLSLACQDTPSLQRLLQSPRLLHRATRLEDAASAAPVAFLFPGFGSQYPGMALELHEGQPAFRKAFDGICALFREEAGIDVLDAISAPENSEALVEAGPFALFAVEYALARLLEALGIRPSYVMGHSAGEYVAATIAGVFSEKDAVRLYVARTRLIGASPPGAMLFVQMGRDALQKKLPEGISVGAVISPNGCVASGAVQGIDDLQAALEAENVPVSRISSEKAGHSSLLESAKPHLRKVLQGVTLHRPRLRVLSNVTGGLLEGDEMTDPEYWVRQMCEPVLLSDEISTLCGSGHVIMLEVGPSRKLSAMLRRHPAFKGRPPVIPVMPSEQGRTGENAALLEAIGQLWQQGGQADWEKVDALNGGGRTVALPGYPFERQALRVEPALQGRVRALSAEGAEVSTLCWQQMFLARPSTFSGVIGFLGVAGSGCAAELERRGWKVVLFPALEDFSRCETIPDVLVDCRFFGEGGNDLATAARVCRQAVAFCARLAELAGERPLSVYWPVSGAVTFGAEELCAERSILLAPARVLPFEAKNTLACVLDVEKGLSDLTMAHILEHAVTNSLAASALTSLVAVRSGMFWQEIPVTLQREPETSSPVRLRDGAAYLVLGGSGGIGRTFMEELAALAEEQRSHITLLPLQRHPRPSGFWEQAANEWTTILPYTADSNDSDAFLKVIDEILKAHDDIGGIVHATGVTGGGLMQTQTANIEDTDNWKAKIVPLSGMERIMDSREVDFVVINTSIGALCGSVGQLDNTAANILLDTWASRQQSRRAARVLSIRWDVWKQVGMINKMASLHERLSGEELAGGVTPAEARRALGFCLGLETPLPVVSGRSLLSMLEEARGKRGLATDALEAADLKVEGAAPRPALAVEWRGARHALDRVLLELFEARLGLRGIGIDDDYVELGGDSLMAMPLAKEIRELFALPAFSVALIFRRRNVANIADSLTESAEEKERLFALAELFEKIKKMEPEEVSKSLEVSR